MRKYIKQFVFLFFCAFLFPSFTYAAIYTEDKVGTYEEELRNFPCEYKTKIEALHKIYPNAIFVAQTTFYYYQPYYKEMPVSWEDMLKAEMNPADRSHIWYTAPANYKTGTCTQNGKWCQATKEGIAYYMNPYNFLNEERVFMFQSQYFNPAETVDGINNILTAGYKNKTCPGTEKTYAEVILEAGRKYNISAYMLASRLVQENPKGTEALASGRCTEEKEDCIKYYNLYNISASGSTDSEVISKGINYAKSKGWDTPTKSIEGSAKFLYTGYIGANDIGGAKGQMTNYLQKWDPYGPKFGAHQYMQNIQAPYSEALTTYKSNIKYNGNQFKYIFYIPIFEGAPNTSNTSCKVEIGDIVIKDYKITSNYIAGIKVGTPINDIINKLKQDNKDAEVTITKNKNNTTDNIATGDIINISLKETKLTYQVVIYGDVDGDGKIYATDYVKIKNHIKGQIKLESAQQQAADVDKDGKIYATDYVKVKNHIKGSSSIAQ